MLNLLKRKININLKYLCMWCDKIFRYKKIMNTRKESFIGLASENDLRIALHYVDAFKVLYESKEYQDHIVIPSLFMVRQFLELGLKYNIKKLTSNNSNQILSSHNLKDIHNHFLGVYRKKKTDLQINKVKDGKYLNDLKSLIDLIMPFDNDSMGYRYSEDNNGKKLIDRDSTYNLENVYKLLESTSCFISSIEDMFVLSSQ